MTQLVKYNAARIALAEAHAVDEVKDIRDKAEAMAAYARQAKDTELLKWVTEIKVRAERKAGLMLAEMTKNSGAKGTGSNQHEVRSHDVTAPPTLADLGITKNESSRWQKLAGVSDEKFEHAVAAAKEVAGEVTTAAMLRVAEPPKPVTEPAYNPADDEVAELAETVRALSAENDALKDRIAIEAMPASEDEKTAALETICMLRKEVSRLEIENRALICSRDSYQRDNADLKRQCAMQRKQIANMEKQAA